MPVLIDAVSYSVIFFYAVLTITAFINNAIALMGGTKTNLVTPTAGWQTMMIVFAQTWEMGQAIIQLSF